MSNNIESKVLEMKFDNAQFEAAVAKTMSTLDKFKDKLNFKNAGDGLDKLGKKSADYQYTLQDVGESLSNLERRFSMVGTVGARIFERLTDSAMGFVSRGLNNIVGSITQGGMSRAMNLEQARFQMAGLLKDSEEVHRVIYDDILPELQGTPFSLDQAAVVIGQLVASGKKSSDQIKRATRGMAGLAAMTGHSFEDVGRIFTKVAGNGVMMAEELNQLSGYGVNAAADLAKFYKGVEKGSYKATKQTKEDMAAIKKAFGEFNEGTIREAASKRLIHYGSMAAAMDELYGAHAQKSTQMYTGALEDLKAALARIGAEPAALRLNFLRDAFNALVPAVDAVNAVIKPFWNASRLGGDAMKGVEEYVRPFTGPLAQNVQEAGWAFQKLFVQLDKNNEIVRATKDSYKKLGLEMHTDEKGIRTFTDALGNVYDEKQALMNPDMLRAITAGTQGFVNVIATLAKTLKAVGRGFKNALPKPTLKGFADLAERFRDFTSQLIPTKQRLHQFSTIAQAVFTPLGLAVRGVVGAFKLVWNVLGQVYKACKPTIDAFMTMGAALGHLIIDLGVFIRELSGAGVGLTGMVMKALGAAAKFLRLDKVATFLQNTFIKMAEVFSSISNDVGGFFATLIGKIQDFGRATYNFLHLGPVIDRLKEFFGIVRDGVKDALHLEEISEAFKKFWEPFKELITSSKMFKVIVGLMKEFIQWLQKLIPFNDVMDNLTEKFEALKEKVSSLTSGPASKIRGWFEKTGKALREFYDNLDSAGVVEKFLKKNLKPFELVKKIDGWVSKYVLPAMDTIGQALSQFFGYENMAAMMGKVVDKIRAGFEALGHLFDWLVQSGKKGLESDKLTKTGKALNNFIHSFDNVGTNAGKLFAPISNAFDKLGEAIHTLTSKADPAAAKKFLIMTSILAMALAYLRTMRHAAKTVDTITHVLTAFAEIPKALSRTIDAFGSIADAIAGLTNSVKVGVYILAIAAGLVVVAAALKLLSTIDVPQLIAGVISLAVLLGGIMTFVALLNKIDIAKNGDRIMKLGISIASIGAAMLALAVAIKIVSDIAGQGNWKSFFASIGAIALLILTMAAAARIMSGVNSFNADIGKIAAAFVGMAQGIKMIVEALKSLAEVKDTESLDHALSHIIAIMAMLSVFSLANFHSGNVAGAAFGMIGLAVALKMIVTAMKSLAKAIGKGRDIAAAEDAISEIVIFMGLFSLAIGGMAKLGGKGRTVMATVLSMAVLMKVMASSLSEIGALASSGILDEAKEVVEEFLMIMVLVSALTAIGGLKAAAGPAAIAALAFALTALAGAISLLGSMSLTQLAQGFYAIAGALIGAIAGLLLFTQIIKVAVDPKTALGIAALGAAMFTFAASIYMLAQLPWQNLLVAMGGLIGIMLAAGVVMMAFGSVSPMMLLAAVAFLAVGAAALFVGAGIFLVTVALSTLIPLIQTLAGADVEKLKQGMNVLIFVAAGLGEVFKAVGDGLAELGRGLFAAGVGAALFGVGILVVAAAVIVTSVAILMLAGSFAVLASVLDAFVPTIKDSIIGAFGGLLSTVTGFFDKMMEKADEVDEKQQRIAEHTKETAKKGMDDVNKTTEEGSAKVQQTATEMWKLPDVEGVAGDKGNLIAQAFTGKLGESLGSADLSPDMAAMLEGVDTSAFQAKADELGYEFPSDLGGALQANAGAAKPGGDAVVKAAADEAKSSGASSGFISAADTGVYKYSSTLKKAKGVKATGKVMAEKGSDGADSEKSGFKDAGLNAARGFANGMDSGINLYVTPKARQLARAAKQASMDELAEASPSKVFIKIGRYVSEGFAIGIESMFGMVESTSKDMADVSISAARISAAAIDAAMTIDDFTPKITPVVDLTNVDQSVDKIGQKFDSAFGLNSPFSAMNAAFAATSFNSANQNDKFKSIDRLSKKIDSMTEAMNSRSLNVYNTIEGSADPEAFADGLIRSFRLNARTV